MRTERKRECERKRVRRVASHKSPTASSQAAREGERRREERGGGERGGVSLSSSRVRGGRWPSALLRPAVEILPASLHALNNSV